VPPVTDPNDFHGELKEIQMHDDLLSRTFDRIVHVAYGLALAAVAVMVATLLLGCGDDQPPVLRDAVADLVAETRVYAERCGLEGWQVNDYERMMCGWEECVTDGNGTTTCWEQLPVADCAAPAPADYDAGRCYADLAALECHPWGVDLPSSCRVLIPWERDS
jgi:hypothetical protein